jgi:hypothetical protein
MEDHTQNIKRVTAAVLLYATLTCYPSKVSTYLSITPPDIYPIFTYLSMLQLV